MRAIAFGNPAGLSQRELIESLDTIISMAIVITTDIRQSLGEKDASSNVQSAISEIISIGKELQGLVKEMKATHDEIREKSQYLVTLPQRYEELRGKQDAQSVKWRTNVKRTFENYRNELLDLYSKILHAAVFINERADELERLSSQIGETLRREAPQLLSRTTSTLGTSVESMVENLMDLVSHLKNFSQTLIDKVSRAKIGLRSKTLEKWRLLTFLFALKD
jgi:hypothetical protein